VSDDEMDDSTVEPLDQTAIEHEAFSMLLVVLKRTAATLNYLEQQSPWNNLTSTVINIIRDSIAKVSYLFLTLTFIFYYGLYCSTTRLVKEFLFANSSTYRPLLVFHYPLRLPMKLFISLLF
jgi:hypothetical protein